MQAEQLEVERWCRMCGMIGTTADHIVPISQGGAREDRTNLQTLCSSCHSKKTGRENAKKLVHKEKRNTSTF